MSYYVLESQIMRKCDYYRLSKKISISCLQVQHQSDNIQYEQQ
jgi:hypothetical protein